MSIGLWVRGARPKTLVTSIASVMVGAVMAYVHIERSGTCIAIYPEPASCATAREQQTLLMDRFWPVTILCLLVALFLQIAFNYANDYSDGIRGTDAGRDMDESKSGKPQRLTASGLVPAKHVLFAAMICAAIACICGIAAIVISQAWWLFAVGVASLLAGWFYTGGKHPYGYAGFGELSVFLFFGLAAVLGTQYALSGSVSVLGVLCAVVAGLLSCQILMVNNLRDINEDRRHGKRTLAVRMGERGARVMLGVCCVVAWAIGVWVVMLLWTPWGGILMLSGIGVPWRMVTSTGRKEFRKALSDACFQPPFFAVILLIFGSIVCACAGSTAGGIKVNRLVLAGKMMRTRLRQQQHPNAIIRIRLDGVIQENEALHAVMIFIVTYLMFILAGTVFGTMLGVDLTTSFTGAVASMGNVGPGFGEVGSMDNFSAMPAAFKVSNSLLMLLGRLEIFGLIQIFFIKWWR